MSKVHLAVQVHQQKFRPELKVCNLIYQAPLLLWQRLSERVCKKVIDVLALGEETI